MPKAYIVFSYHSIADPQKFAAYAKLAPTRPLRFPRSRPRHCCGGKSNLRYRSNVQVMPLSR
jgi:hypothetical protein